jgi:arginine transport system substrate-binding protein
MNKNSVYAKIMPVIFGFVTAFVVGCGVFFAYYDQKEQDDQLVVGTNVGYPPFIFTDQKGTVVGFDADLVETIAQKLNKKLVLKHMAFDALIVALKKGKVDMIIGGISITKQRLKEIDMIAYHGEKLTSLSLLFWKQVPEGVNSLTDLYTLFPHVIMCTQAGTIFHDYLEQFSHVVEIKTFDDIPETLMDLQAGKSKALIFEPDTAYSLQRANPNIKVVTFPIDEKDQLLGNGIGISKQNTSLSAKVKKIVGELKKSHTLQTLANKWFEGSLKQ